MRYLSIAAAMIVAGSCCLAPAAPPVFGVGQAAPAPGFQLRAPRLRKLLGWGSQPQQPQQAWQQQPWAQQAMGQPPTRMQRLKQTLTQNPVADALRPQPQAPVAPAQPDELSLNKPVNEPTPEMLVALAEVAESSGDLAAARSYFGQAVAAAPKRIKTFRQHGRFEDRQGQLTTAEQIYRQALLIDPHHAASLNDLALCLARQGQLEKSVEVLEQAIVQRPASALYRNNVAKVLIETGDKPRAIAHLSAVHGPAVAQFNVGQLLVASGRTAEALDHFRQASAIDPSFELARTTLAKYDPAQATPQVAALPELPTLEPSEQPAAPSVAPGQNVTQ